MKITLSKKIFEEISQMKFAFLIMGDFNFEVDRATIDGGSAQMIGVSNIEEACKVAVELAKDGVTCIELCGAFEAQGARRIIEATDNKLPIGYVTHFPEQDEIFRATFE